VVALAAASIPAILESINAPALNHDIFIRNLLFVIVPAAALGLSTVLDYLCLGYNLISGTALAAAVLGIVANTLALASGIIGFLIIPHNNAPLTATALWIFSIQICLALFFSLLTEIYVSKDHHRCHVSARGVAPPPVPGPVPQPTAEPVR
jgi:hypothetical protein